MLDQVGERERLHRLIILQGGVEVGDIGRVMLVVMDLHGQGIDRRFVGVVSIGQGRQDEGVEQRRGRIDRTARGVRRERERGAQREQALRTSETCGVG